MLLDAILGFQVVDLLHNLGFIHRLVGFPSHQQHVFRRVFHLDKLHHLCLVAIIFQDQGTDGVGNHHGLTFEEDAVACDGVETPRVFHLLANLLVTAGRADDQTGKPEVL